MSLSLLKNHSLAADTTLQVGGTPAVFTAVHTEELLTQAIDQALVSHLPLVILGGGSNVLIADGPLSVFVIKVSIPGVDFTTTGNEVFVTAGAGVELDALVEMCVEKGYWGLENLSHIPGSVGATPVQNVGAYGVEVSELISLVRVYDTQKNTFLSLSAAECEFGYRDSVFKKASGRRYIVTAVTFRLSMLPAPRLAYKDLADYFATAGEVSLLSIRTAVMSIRAAKFPDWRSVGTAGSFFKNPVISTAHYEELRRCYPELPGYPHADGSVKIALGWILDKVLHLKGEGTAAVGCYEGQALVLINRGNATAQEIKSFAEGIQEQVKEKMNITIECEVRLIGFS